MKLWNKALAGQKMRARNGDLLEVGKDGCVEVSDEEVANALLHSGFRSEEPEGQPKPTPKPAPSKPVVEEAKAPEPEEELTNEDFEEESDEEEDDEEEDGDELEIENLADYNAKDAMELVGSTDDLDVLEAWKTSEGEGKNRKSVLKTISERISEVS